MYRILACIIVVAYALSAEILYAQEERSDVLLDAEVEVSFLPESAFMLIFDGQKVRRSPATIVSPFTDKEGKELRSTGKWLIGVRSTFPAGRKLYCAVVLLGTKDELAVTSLMEHIPGAIADVFEDIDSFRRYVQERKSLLQKNLSQEAQQEGELGRLQADVDMIADIGRIVEVREESLSAEEDLKRLERDAANYELALNQVSIYPQPKNFLRRESELNRQLIDLNVAAKHAEELRKKREGETVETPAQKRALIESVKNENEQALVQKLGTLRRYRTELEEQQGLQLNH